MKRPHLKLILTASLALLLIQNLAQAHAFLDHAEPKVGSTVAAAPTELKIWFTQDVEPALSTIQVFDDHQNQVDKKDTHGSDKDKSLLTVSLSNLPPGNYHVHWRVVSVDTHVTENEFKFSIK